MTKHSNKKIPKKPAAVVLAIVAILVLVLGFAYFIPKHSANTTVDTTGWETYHSPRSGISFRYPAGATISPMEGSAMTDVPEKDVQNLTGFMISLAKPDTATAYGKAESTEASDNLQLYINFGKTPEFYQEESTDLKIVKIGTGDYAYMLAKIQTVEGSRYGGAPIRYDSDNYRTMKQMFDSITY